jgi:hypothetical protein
MTESKLPQREAVATLAQELRRSRSTAATGTPRRSRTKHQTGNARVLELGCGHLDFTLDYLQRACGELVATTSSQLFGQGTPLPPGVSFQLEDALDLFLARQLIRLRDRT